jgi:hypothetical protein
MAGTRAIAATLNAIRHVLEVEAPGTDFGGVQLQFAVYGPDDFRTGEVTSGASIFLYRVLPNLSHRIPSGRIQPDGSRRRTQLPVDVHVLLTAWASSAATENAIVGWMMRTIEDYPTLPASILNVNDPGVFRDEESVEIVIGEMPGEELLHLWEVLGQGRYHVTIPYVARAIYIESQREMVGAGSVQTRALDMRRFGASS